MEFKHAAETVIKALDKYYSESVSGNCRVINQRPMHEIIDNLNLSGYLTEGNFSEDCLSEFLDKYLSYTTCLHHPAYLAHQVAVPHFAAHLWDQAGAVRMRAANYRRQECHTGTARIRERITQAVLPFWPAVFVTVTSVIAAIQVRRH